MGDDGRRYKNLDQTLRYTGCTVSALKNLIDFAGLRFVDSGDGPVFDTRDIQKAMHRAKTEAIGGSVLDHFAKALFADIEERNTKRREADKDKPKQTIVFNAENSGKPPFTIETVSEEAKAPRQETQEAAEESSGSGDLFCEDNNCHC